MGFYHQPKIIRDNLVFYVDYKNPKCYNGSSSYDLISRVEGTTNGSASYNPEGYFEFSADNTQYVEFSPLSPSGQTNITISIWCRYNVEETAKAVFSWYQPGTYKGIIIQTDNSAPKRLLYYIGSIGGEIEYQKTDQLSIDTWFNLGYVYDGTESQNADKLKLFLNGRQDTNLSYSSSFPSAFPTITSNKMEIGNGSPLNRPWKGDVAIVAIWFKTLSAFEVLQNYNALKSRFGL